MMMMMMGSVDAHYTQPRVEIENAATLGRRSGCGGSTGIIGLISI